MTASTTSQAFQPIAILYQAEPPPTVSGLSKPMKPGGYRDSGADIAYVLQNRGLPIVTPVEAPLPQRELDWVFPDSREGIQRAVTKGARSLWANTVLYVGHPLQNLDFRGLGCVGQPAEKVERFDDKWTANQELAQAGCPTPHATVIDGSWISTREFPAGSFHFPLVVKPIRGRGSEGVHRVDSWSELRAKASELLALGTFGDRLMLEEYLAGREITVTVMPPGIYDWNGQEKHFDGAWTLPGVERLNHQSGIAPYSGKVAVTSNSRVMSESEQRAPEYQQLKTNCERAFELVGARAPIRIDCRAPQTSGVGALEDRAYRLFDVNLKPNMTGPGRPGRADQASLSALAAQAIGWDYSEFIANLARQVWPL